MLGQRDRHISSRGKNVWHANYFRETRGDQISQCTNAVDDGVRLAVGQGRKSFRQIIVFFVFEMQSVEIFRS
jgi:hypothetical protein